MASSSYTKISTNLLQKPETQILIDEIVNGFINARICDYKFLLSRMKKFASTETIYKIRFARHTVWINATDQPTLMPRVEHLIPLDDLNQIVNIYWYKNDFPTYSCKKNSVMTGGRNGVGFRRTVNSELATRLNCGSIVSDTIEHLRSQRLTIEASEEFKFKRLSFLKEQAVRDIGEVMRFYHNLGDDILKEAFQDFVVNFTLEI